jgi:5-methylcytosine-specific restriction endonuclease McrA
MKSEAWMKKSDERRKIDNWKCCVCGKPASKCRYGLQVHHLTYDRLGHEDVLHDIVSLCGKCHKMIHLGDVITMRRAYRSAGYNVSGNDLDYKGLNINQCIRGEQQNG